MDVLCSKQEPCPRSHLVIRHGAQFTIGPRKEASSPSIKAMICYIGTAVPYVLYMKRLKVGTPRPHSAVFGTYIIVVTSPKLR